MNISRFSVSLTTLVLCLAVCPVLAQTTQPEPVLPIVKSAEVPLYPYLSRLARIEGTALMHVWTDGTSIVKVQGSGAHQMLMGAAEDNLRTWRFYPHKPTSFTVTFVYSLDKVEIAGQVNPSIVLQLPTRVEIRTKLHPIETMELN